MLFKLEFKAKWIIITLKVTESRLEYFSLLIPSWFLSVIILFEASQTGSLNCTVAFYIDPMNINVDCNHAVQTACLNQVLLLGIEIFQHF